MPSVTSGVAAWWDADMVWPMSTSTCAGIRRDGRRCTQPVRSPGGLCGRCRPPAPPSASSVRAVPHVDPYADMVDPATEDLGSTATPAWQDLPESATTWALIQDHPDTPVPTPDGTIPAGDLRAGDTIHMDVFDGTIGVRDDRADQTFTLGGCAIMAAALHDRTGWPVVAVGDADTGPDACGCAPDDCYDYDFDLEDDDGDGPDPEWCDCRVAHFMVRSPDGMVWDVRGEHDPEPLCDDGRTIRPVPDRVLSSVLGGWDHPPGIVTYARSLLDDIVAGD